MSDSIARQRVGIYGGTFNPIHLGHLLIAEIVKEALQLAEIRFIPAFIAPHKQDQKPLDSKHRVEMIRLAIGGNPAFKVDQCELERGGTSYTVDTLESLTRDNPSAEFIFLMGADSLAEFHTWRNPQRICELSFVAVVARGGQPQPDMTVLQKWLPADQQNAVANHLVSVPQMELSSTEIRRRITQNQTIRYQVPAAVEAYIRQWELYRQPQ